MLVYNILFGRHKFLTEIVRFEPLDKLYEQATSLKDKIVPLGNKVVEAQRQMNSLAGTFEKQFAELGLKFSDYPEYKNVSNFMSRSAMVTDMVGYIRQI